MIEAESSSGPPVRAPCSVIRFGGKVTLAVAATPPAALRQIWMIDASPGTGTPAGSAWNMLTHVRSLPPAFAARADAIAGLEKLGWPTGVASWMATNLRYTDGEYRWALDFDALETLLHSYFTTDLWHVIESPPPNLDIHIVKAHAVEHGERGRVRANLARGGSDRPRPSASGRRRPLGAHRQSEGAGRAVVGVAAQNGG